MVSLQEKPTILNKKKHTHTQSVNVIQYSHWKKIINIWLFHFLTRTFSVEQLTLAAPAFGITLHAAAKCFG